MKFLLTAAVMSLSFSSLAASLTCDIVPIVADKGGYANFGSRFTMTAEIQKEGTLNGKRCNEIKSNNKIISLCVAEASFAGGYDVSLFVLDGGGVQPVQNTAVIATSRKDNRELIKLFGDSELLYSAYVKLQNGKIPFYRFWNGNDAAELDEGVNNAISNNVLAHNDVLFYGITTCKMN